MSSLKTGKCIMSNKSKKRDGGNPFGFNSMAGTGCGGIGNTLGLFFTIAFLLSSVVTLFAGQDTIFSKPLKVGFSARVFPNVDQGDARVAMELWTRELARGLGFRTQPQTVIFQKPSDLLKAVNNGEMTVVTLPATEYLQIKDKALMTPAIVEASNDGLSRRFVLIVRSDSGIRSLVGLRGKPILIPSSTKQSASHLWLDILLLRSGVGERNSFFSEVKESTASQSIMGVFFKKADAAIVSRTALEMSKSLNAQISKRINVIAESKSLIGDITCIPSSNDNRMKRAVETAALHLHETATGKQMFTLFQVERTIPFKQEYLDGLIELLREKERLSAKTGKRR
jgi:ABC-type phosphate/phosphonate transport system substrate-binding protein